MKSEEIKSVMYYFPKYLEILYTQLGYRQIWYVWPLKDMEDYTDDHWFWQCNRGLLMTAMHEDLH